MAYSKVNYRHFYVVCCQVFSSSYTDVNLYYSHKTVRFTKVQFHTTPRSKILVHLFILLSSLLFHCCWICRIHFRKSRNMKDSLKTFWFEVHVTILQFGNPHEILPFCQFIRTKFRIVVSQQISKNPSHDLDLVNANHGQEPTINK